ncbi:hypothetical protein Pmani_021339 [Petrolisthes manimaculis]|uniref:Uncharacterized protein n=1 Tax=Petrolisthes manimaculis TaxID=1843537 RepID=A0AAE1PF51_9EUCA|nr:hypothetical protein Pmani_021339 [Petrolisthes manimaculis]
MNILRVLCVSAVAVGWCSGGLVGYSFTYHQGPITSRSETLDLQGIVRGTFNFLDSRGNIKTQNYDYRADVVQQPWVNVSPSQVFEYAPQKTEHVSPDTTEVEPVSQDGDNNNNEDNVEESDLATEEPEVTTIPPLMDIQEPKQDKPKESGDPENSSASTTATATTVVATGPR